MRGKIVLILICLGTALFAQTSMDALLAEADQAFREERFNDSARLYQEAAVRGNVNSAVYYNQGNAWFMAGEEHLAHLSYLKAEQLSPGDGDIKRNLSFIRALSGEQEERSGRNELLRVLFFWHYDLSLRLRGIMLLVANGVFWGILTLFILRKRKGLSFPMGALLVAGFLALSLLVSTGVSRYDQENHPTGLILKDATARKGDGDNFEEAFNRPLTGGTEFRLEEVRSDWYRITLADGSEGWIKKSEAGLVNYP
ncbi:MAG: SH3 domain-containing protein [Spirochaetales bacterium]|nr:SH3 domain-containing protein [Spirochaetales bacterium]